MKLKPETLAFLRNLSKQERQSFLEYLRDADDNISSEVNHLDNIPTEYVTNNSKDE